MGFNISGYRGKCVLLTIFKPVAQGRKRNGLANCLARQFAQLFPLVCGGVFVTISPRKAERKISVMFDIFGLERQIPHGVRWSLSSYQAIEKLITILIDDTLMIIINDNWWQLMIKSDLAIEKLICVNG